MSVVLRRIFPLKSECPHCHDARWRAAGKSADGGLLYRRCVACSQTYRVSPIAEERDEGGAWSRIVPVG